MTAIYFDIYHSLSLSEITLLIYFDSLSSLTFVSFQCTCQFVYQHFPYPSLLRFSTPGSKLTCPTNRFHF